MNEPNNKGKVSSPFTLAKAVDELEPAIPAPKIPEPRRKLPTLLTVYAPANTTGYVFTDETQARALCEANDLPVDVVPVNAVDVNGELYLLTNPVSLSTLSNETYDKLRQKALAKLSPVERVALGISEKA